MQILYVDEYGEDLYLSEGGIIPSIGDTVSLEDEDWKVKSRTFVPMQTAVVIELTQTYLKSKTEEDGVGGRLQEMQRAIIEVKGRQDKQEKRTKSLREQAMSIRQHIRNLPKPKEIT